MVAPLVSISPQLIPQFYNSTGAPLSGGLLQCYAAGTTTPIPTYSDATGASALPNPIVLNANGNPTTGGAVTSGIWLTEGIAYKFQLQTATGSPIWTVDNVLATGPFAFYAGTSTGTANAYALAQPQISAYATPFEISFIANFTNTGAATLNINGLGTRNIYRVTTGGPAALVGGEIVSGQIVTVVYDGTEFQITSDSAASPVLRSYLAGLNTSNDSGAPNTVIDIGAGSAVDTTNTILMTAGPFTKSTSGSWVAGTGNAGMGVGLTIANNTWYHVFQISLAGVIDYYFDTSVTAANKPIGTNYFRRIWSFRTDGSAHILAYIQDGDYYRWAASIADFADTNPGITAVTKTLSGVPPGVAVQALAGVSLTADSTNYFVYFSDPAANDEAATASISNAASIASGQIAFPMQIRTNTGQQIRYRLNSSNGASIVRWASLGYFDTRGRNA